VPIGEGTRPCGSPVNELGVERASPCSERIVEYEAKLNTFLPGSQCLAVCQYDQRNSIRACCWISWRPIPWQCRDEVYDNF